ncbi:MAG: YbaB/EbfC family nucleoid-associated protein [Actinobacteria bacterium]|nr:YbaB/EbfC family nucleoid-associated protein [Actinomycetota bacterium]
MSKGKYYPKGQKGQKGGGRSQDMMKQLQQVQQQMSAMQDELAEETVEHSAGGGMVTVVVDGQQNIKSIKIDPQVVDPEDVGMLEDLVLAAVVGALEKSSEMAADRMGGLTGGLGLPDF